MPFILMFGFLLFIKSFHWLAGDRIEWVRTFNSAHLNDETHVSIDGPAAISRTSSVIPPQNDGTIRDLMAY